LTGIKSKLIMAGLAVLALAACGSGLTPAQQAQQSQDAAADASMASAAYASASAADASQSAAAASMSAEAVPPTSIGYMPNPEPSAAPSSQKAAAARVAAEKKAAAERAHRIHEARIAAENTPISAAQWGMVIRNPDNYTGDIYTISGTVTEYNINSNTLATQVNNAALVAEDSNGNLFVVEAPASLLGNVQPGDTFSAKVTVLGSEEAENTVYGGTSEVPDFDASTFTITG
jgi:hypothetical protein